MNLSPDLKEFIESLNSHKVEFVIIGAHALAYYGLPRYTKDVDFFVGTSPENRAALVDAINDFGFASTGLSADDFATPDQIIQLGLAPNRIDLLTGISGVSWQEVWSTSTRGQLDTLPVQIIGTAAYLKNKLASGRPQDLADAARLRSILEDH